MLGWEATLEGIDGDVLKVTMYLIVHLQYLSEYVFRVSPSCIDKDNKESKGRGTLYM